VISSLCDLLDFCLQHSNDEELAHRVENNTLRYIKYFEEIADELMPASAGVENDVFDVLNVSNWPPLIASHPATLQNQRLSHLGTGDEASLSSAIPKSLTRRFEVTVIPRASEAVRKLREVKANGAYLPPSPP
jgi:hypothetical protein